MKNQMELCSCGHVLLLHSSACKGRHRGAACKCRSFDAASAPKLSDALKPSSMGALMDLRKRLAPKPPRINIYGKSNAMLLREDTVCLK